jgi:hypothetical protein
LVILLLVYVQQQRGDEQGGSESHDPARGHPQHDCSVHVA